MLKFFSVNKNQFGILITLMVLILLGASYFFVYLPDNEKTVQERRFLCLQNIDDNVHSKIDNSISMLNNLLTDYTTTKNADNLTRYIINYPKEHFTLFPAERNKIVNYKSRINDTVTTFRINADPASQQFTLFVSKTKLSDSLTMGMRFGFEQFVKPLLPADVFDQYIVFNTGKTANNKTSNDKVVYQTFPSGLSYKSKDSLLNFKNGMSTPGVRSLTIGGTDYKAFSQPVSFGGDSEWIIVGLVSGKHYNKEKNQLPVWIVLLLLTLAIGTIVSLPWIKLYHMGNKDKLTITDGLCSVLVSMLLMSLLFFVFFKYNLYLTDNTSSKSRDSLADNISNSFKGELDKAYHVLEKFDSEYANVRDDITNLGKDTLRSKLGRIDETEKKKLNSIAKNILVQQVYWLDKTGKELNNWTRDTVYVPHSNFGSREYFKRVVNNKTYRLNSDEFYLAQVISRTSGEFTSVIARKPSDRNIAVVAMSFTAKSLDHVVMPDGYQFAIIDRKGEVLYHSLADRNLNENLKKELADSTELVSCIEAKSDTSFKEEYYGKSNYIKIKPLEDLPYYVVVFEDQEYNDTRDTEAYAFTVSMLGFLLIFLIAQFSIVFFASSKKSFFKKQLFETSWIGPKKVFHKHYNLAIIINLTIIALLVYYFDLSSFLKYLYLVLFSVTFIALFTNGIFAGYYKKTNHYNLRFKIFAIFWLLVFVVVIDYAAYHTLESGNFKSLLFYEIILTVICGGMMLACIMVKSWWPELLGKAYDFKNSINFPWTYTHSYSLMATTRLVVTSGIPVAFFFIYSFNYEQNLDTRYKQYHFARALNQKLSNTINKPEGRTTDLQHAEAIYPDSTFIQTIGQTRKGINLTYTNEDFLTVQILSLFRLQENDVAVKSSNMNLASVDGKAFFNSLTHEQTGNATTTQTFYKIAPDNYIALSSAKNVYYLSHKGLLVPLLIVLIVGFYYMIHNIIRKLFALGLPLQDGWKEMDKKILLDNELNSLLLIVGPPGSGKLHKLKERIDEGEMKGHDGHKLIYNEKDPSMNNVFVADMIRIPAQNGEYNNWRKHKEEALKKTNALVIVNHFEYNIKDPGTNSTKLDFLESLMLQGVSKVMIISTVHPLTFLDSFDEEQNNIKPNSQSGDANGGQQSNSIPISELERWHVLLGHFRIVVESLESKNCEDEDILRESIKEETQYTHYLNDIRDKALETIPFLNNQGVGLPTDSLIFKLQLSSHYFYTYIWQSLTKEEKFLLYDLAEDGLVNPFDDYNLSMLIYKGLITREKGTLTLFNKGFRNYILTAIGNSEVERIKAQVKDNGNWGNLKTPLNLAILAILVFLIASQQEAYTKIITYITALGAGIPAVLRIFTLVGSSKSTQKTE